MLVTRIRAGVLVAFSLTATCAVLAQTRWDSNAPDATGVEAPFQPRMEADVLPEPVISAQVQPMETAAPRAVDALPDVDESALRYFAREGDQRRLEIEIARLRALYPNWTPPADPLAVPRLSDERLEALWQLYSQGRYAEVRAAVAQRQASEPSWQPPADLLSRLELAEARERLINASNLKQYETVIRVASENSSLLTCSEVDVLWRVAEAFANTDRGERARDTYRYVLKTCEDPQERLATLQKALDLLDAGLLQDLLSMERPGVSGGGEFSAIRDEIARRAVAAGVSDPGTEAPLEQLATVERLAESGRSGADALLLGWYALRRERPEASEKWFRLAREIEDGPEAAQGLATALVARGKYAEAEAAAFPWRAANDDVGKTYLAAAANLLGTEPRPVLQPEVLERIVAEVSAARDVAAAQQLGWYARAFNQFETAARWFSAALSWDPDDEPSAYGLALTRHQLGDSDGLAEIKRLWSGRSERIGSVARPASRTRTDVADPAATRAARDERPATAAPARAPTTAGRGPERAAPAAPVTVGCAAADSRNRLSPAAALARGWCLLDLDRPLEAALAFDVVLESGGEQARSDAAYGQSLAYLRAGLVDDAALAATRAPIPPRRATELQASILAERALSAYEQQQYVEALRALDQRALYAADRIDLLVIRGYIYLSMGRRGDAVRTFEAAAATGSRDALRGLAAARDDENSR